VLTHKFGLSQNALDFVMELLRTEPGRRLGCQGVQQIKSHPWVRDLDWNGIKHQTCKSPLRIDANTRYFRQNIPLQDADENKRFVAQLDLNRDQLAQFLKNYDFIEKERCKKLFK